MSVCGEYVGNGVRLKLLDRTFPERYNIAGSKHLRSKLLMGKILTLTPLLAV